MTNKSHTYTIFLSFKALVENQSNSKIKTFYSDNGGEFQKLKPIFVSNGIAHLTSPPHTPEHNGVAERRHRHIVETTLCF